jgi:hypothetical protein
MLRIAILLLFLSGCAYKYGAAERAERDAKEAASLKDGRISNEAWSRATGP